jgi:hypothetical protein
MKTPVLCVIGLAGCSLLAACSGARDEESGTSSKLVATLAPNYAFGLQAEITTKNKTTGALATNGAKLYGRVVINSQADGAVKFSLDPCSIVLPTVSGYQPVIDDAFLQSTLPDVAYDATLSATGALVAPPQPVLLGVRLTNPVTDPFPTVGTDPAVFDQDHDGKPGITIKVDTGLLGIKSVYAGARLLAGFKGTVGADGRILGLGSAESTFSYTIFGDDIPFVDVAALATQAADDVEVVKQETRFVAVPKGAELTCAQVKADLPVIPETIAAPPPEAPVAAPTETATE